MKKTITKIFKFVKNPKQHYENLYFIKYHLYKAFYKLFTKMKIIKTNDLGNSDTFNWKFYNLHYRGEFKNTSKEVTADLKENDYIFKDEKLVKLNNDILPLHENHRLLYEAILQLHPESVFEMGCGNGIHLHNISMLAPNIKLSGVDLLEDQLKFLQEVHPELSADVKQMDATKPFPENLQKADLSFTQAVLMHIHTGETHKDALANLFNISEKYVVMAEKWQNHPLMDDIKELADKKIIKWEKIYFYYKENDKTKKPYFMICSKEPLENFPVLTDYKTLLY